mgnify:FL=1
MAPQSRSAHDGDVANGRERLEAAMMKRNPYSVDRYHVEPAGGVRGALSQAAGLIFGIGAMAGLSLGMIFLMWRAGGR